MPVLDLSSYEPAPNTDLDANQIKNGFAAIQTTVNGLDNNNVAAGAAIAYSKLNLSASVKQSDMAAGNKVTTSALSGGPPGSPSDGDIWIATGVDANGTRWQFQYNAGSVSSYKWEFLGGFPAHVLVDTAETTTSLTYTDLATAGPSFTAVRAGEYKATISAYDYNDTSGKVNFASPKVGSGSATDYTGLTHTNSTATAELRYSAETPILTAAANDVIKVQYRVTGGTGTFRARILAVTPRRIA